MNTHLCAKIKLKNKLGSKSARNPNNISLQKRYRKCCKDLKSLISFTKEKFYGDKLMSVQLNSKKEWGVVNHLLNRKSSKVELEKIKYNNINIVDKKIIADMLNDKFTNTE